MKARLHGSNGPDVDFDFVVPRHRTFDGCVELAPRKVRVAPSLGLVAMTFGRSGLWRTDGTLVAYDSSEFVDVDLLPDTGRVLSVGGTARCWWLGYLDPTDLHVLTRVEIDAQPGCAVAEVVAHEGVGLCAVIWRGQTEWGYDIYRLDSLKGVPELSFGSDAAEASTAAFSPDGRFLVATFAARDGWWLADDVRDESLTTPSSGGVYVVGYVRVHQLASNVASTVTVRAKVAAGYRPDDADSYLMQRIWGPYDAGEEDFAIRLPGGSFVRVRYDSRADVVASLEGEAVGPGRAHMNEVGPATPGPRIQIEALPLAPGSSSKKLDAMVAKLDSALADAAVRDPMAVGRQSLLFREAASDAAGHGRFDDARRLLEAALDVAAVPFLVTDRVGDVVVRVGAKSIVTQGRPFDSNVTRETEWLETAHLAFVFRRADVVSALAEFPTDRFPDGPFVRHTLAHVAFARSVLRNDGQWEGLAPAVDSQYRLLSEKPRAALRLASDWHAFECLLAIARRDGAAFERHLVQTLEAHKTRRSQEDPTNPLNRFCIPALGMAALGADRGFPIRVDCDYMPRWLVFAPRTS